MLPAHPELRSRLFGVSPNGEPIYGWRLCGTDGFELEVISYGATLTRMLVPDRYGNRDDVVLGFGALEPYLARHPYFGSAIGRVAGRITKSAFTLDGKTYALTRNEAPNHLHGGVHGFDRKTWKAESLHSERGRSSITLTCESIDGEEGYPGNVKVRLTYSVTGANSFVVQVEAESDKPTLFNFTQHAYFNLGGEHRGSVEDHLIEITADQYVPTDDRLTLSGRLDPLDGRPNDFRRLTCLKTAIPQLFQRHGDLYCLRKASHPSDRKQPEKAARLVHPQSGRMLTVSTTESYLQFYTGSALDGAFTGKAGRAYGRYAGLCLECHGYPDGANTPTLGDIILRPGKPIRATTIFTFSTMT